MLIMLELLIMGNPWLRREPMSGRSWTSKVFNTLITLDTYQFEYITYPANVCYVDPTDLLPTMYIRGFTKFGIKVL